MSSSKRIYVDDGHVVKEETTPLRAKAFCNLHGLWKGKGMETKVK